MKGTSSRTTTGRLQPPIRRVLTVDPGSRRFKLLLGQSTFGRLRVLREEMIDLQAEGLMGPEEFQAHLRTAVDECARPPLALAIPQQLATSITLELPENPEARIEDLIQQESVKLSGVSESRILYDFVPAGTRGSRRRFWVTLSQESAIRERIHRAGLDDEDVCEVTTAANALISAYRWCAPGAKKSILVHLGASATLLVVLLDGQGVFASSFEMAGDLFTRSLARSLALPEDQAETLKQTANLFEGPQAAPEFVPVVDGWVAEIKSQLQDWLAANQDPSLALSQFEVIACGGGFDQLGLRERLEAKSGFKVQPWPLGSDPERPAPGRGFEIAFGTMLQALGLSSHPVSLLPADCRAAWRKRLARQLLEAGSAVVLAAVLLLLAMGTWRQLSLVARKEALLAKVRAGQESVDLNNSLNTELVGSYEGLRRILAAQANTFDTLKMLGLLQDARSNHPFWFVLVADQQTYFTQNPAFTDTNVPPVTNLVTFADRRRPPGEPYRAEAWDTNATPAKPGYIAELCIPSDSEAARATLSRMVEALKQDKLFAKCDLLSEDLRVKAVDPKVVLADRHFALALDFSLNDFNAPIPPRKTNAPPAIRPAPRRPAAEGEPPPRPSL